MSRKESLEYLVQDSDADRGSPIEIWSLQFRTCDDRSLWAPVLVQGGRLLHYPSTWLLSSALDNFPTSTLQARANALRRFAQYFLAFRPLQLPHTATEQECKNVSTAAVVGYQNTLAQGSKKLGWRQMSLSQARVYRQWLDMFCDWLVDKSGLDPALHPNPLLQRRRPEHWEVAESRVQRDILGHLYLATKAAREQKTRSIGEHSPTWSKRHHPFRGNPDKPELEVARPRPPMMPIDDYYKLLAATRAQRNWRDECLWLSLGAGCARVSEALNVYATDVLADDKGEAYLALANPVEGLVEQQGKWIMRREFLEHRYGLIPRPLLPANDPLRAGWKGMAVGGIQVDEIPEIQLWPQRGWALVEWLFPSFGKQFWYSWTQYREQIQRLGIRINHPYAFINLEHNVGAPLTRQNVNQLLEVACMRGLASIK